MPQKTLRDLTPKTEQAIQRQITTLKKELETAKKKLDQQFGKELKNIRARVRRGIKLLDEKGPEGWDKKLNLEMLKLKSPRACVLGQAYKDALNNGVTHANGYVAGVSKLFAEEDGLGFAMNDSHYGFNIASPWEEGFRDDTLIIGHNVEYDYLTAIWIEELKARRQRNRGSRARRSR